MVQNRELLSPYAMLRIPGSGNNRPVSAGEISNAADFGEVTYTPNPWDPPLQLRGIRLLSFSRRDYGYLSIHGRIDFTREGHGPQSWALQQERGELEIYTMVEGAPKSVLLTDLQAQRVADYRYHRLPLAELVLKKGTKPLTRIYEGDIDFDKSRTFDLCFFEGTGDAVQTLIALNEAITRARTERGQSPIHQALAV